MKYETLIETRCAFESALGTLRATLMHSQVLSQVCTTDAVRDFVVPQDRFNAVIQEAESTLRKLNYEILSYELEQEHSIDANSDILFGGNQ